MESINPLHHQLALIRAFICRTCVTSKIQTPAMTQNACLCYVVTRLQEGHATIGLLPTSIVGFDKSAMCMGNNIIVF